LELLLQQQQQLLLPGGQHLEIQEPRSPTETSLADRRESEGELAARIELSHCVLLCSTSKREAYGARACSGELRRHGPRYMYISLSRYLNY
jgi:hypothetical protein